MSMPQVSISLKNVDNAASCGVSTPYGGKRSPVNELVCDNGRLTPDICDIGGPTWPRGDRLRTCDCACASMLAATSFSSMRNDGKSNSWVLSVEYQKLKYIMFYEIFDIYTRSLILIYRTIGYRI